MPNIDLNTPVYHITHIDNLSRIIQTNGLWCDRERTRQSFESINIAHNDLKDRRMFTPVPIYEGKTLGDFVPFYFTNRSPMLYSIHTGYIEGYTGTQDEIIYLVTTIRNLLKIERGWCFTDGHAVEILSKFYNDTKKLNKIDYDVINDWSWHNRDEDPDRKRRKQAEFLIETSVPLNAFTEIGVMNDRIKQKVEKILIRFKKRISVSLQNRWYY